MSSKAKSITVKQAERILECDMLNKDFWYVTDKDDNHDILQDVLDIMFNSIEGQKYEVRYMHQTNHSRLVIYCGVCRKDLSSYDPFIAHDSGKPHKKAVSKHNSLKEQEVIEHDVIFKDPLAPLFIFESGTLEDKIDQTTKPVVGLQFIYKERLKDTFYFTCQVCLRKRNAFRLSADEMFSHVTSSVHITKFMEDIHNIREASFQSLLPRVHRIMYRNGKITHPIIEFEWNTYNGRDYVSRREAWKRSPSPEFLSSRKRERVRDSSSVTILRPSPEVISTSEFACQVNIPTKTMQDFVQELSVCVEEKEAISYLLQDTSPAEQQILTTTVKVFSNALHDYCDKNEDENFTKMITEFNKMTSKL